MADRLEELRQIRTRRDDEIAHFKEQMKVGLAENSELENTIETHWAEIQDLNNLLAETSTN